MFSKGVLIGKKVKEFRIKRGKKQDSGGKKGFVRALSCFSERRGLQG